MGELRAVTVETGEVRWPAGFLAAGVNAGLKKNGKLDLALVASLQPAGAAGVFTRNRVQAAPVLVTREHLKSGRLRGLVCNSGRANACVGERGLADARTMAAEAARVLAEVLGGPIAPGEIAVASTGVIGVPLNVEAVKEGIRRAGAALSTTGFAAAARAIMTTDTRPKMAGVTVPAHGGEFTVAGMAKGSGMIHPDLATMLAFLFTDARAGAEELRGVLGRAADDTFNMLTVDGDTSTNDMVVLMANGASGVEPAREVLQEAVTAVCLELAREIARDGEGASRYLEVEVRGAVTLADARRAARAVASSSLVKTAVAGADPNWGRILAALGYSGASFDPGRVAVFLGPVQVADRGVEIPFDEGEARRALSGTEVHILVDLGGGPHRARAFGCDLTEDYVRINASYRS
ncbi:MAG: bifunctional glutamate N-acetyltransferase/amino-acid acetyltransferase ArgJ [Bacillota bacterium]|nr:bifunctional glutamate N-acetyltransferase/amino-acid acetyltransferase ArgJ [Bacillota bacterium]MDI7249036.1 bifunctional glutamate N-acetyltransferase/amino-acid acetyltransferase ArgJ [Bacillota bacterium]